MAERCANARSSASTHNIAFVASVSTPLGQVPYTLRHGRDKFYQAPPFLHATLENREVAWERGHRKGSSHFFKMLPHFNVIVSFTEVP